MVTSTHWLRCASCGAAGNADDEFCEACGRPAGAAHDARYDHHELDLGVAAGVTDRGHVHARNEDAMFVTVTGRGVVAVVCDGVSTSAAPHVAARVAASTAGELLVESLDRGAPSEADLTAALHAADLAVRALPWAATPGVLGPACTVVAAVWDGTTVHLAWAGDSRAYWATSTGAERLTVDHSWAQEQVDAGRLDEAAAATDVRAHVITRWLGDGGVDDGLGRGPSSATLRPAGPGHLVVCTDGLWNDIADPAALARLAAPSATASSLERAQALCAAALARGGRDNVTVVVAEVRPVRHADAEEGAP